MDLQSRYDLETKKTGWALCARWHSIGERWRALVGRPTPPLNTVSKKIAGRTGFEPATSSVSGKSRTVPGVCHGRTESNGEPLTWADILNGSR
jgi:hypothetical protein